MNKIAKFEKVSYEQFEKDVIALMPEYGYRKFEIKEIYDEIKLPQRATKGSAGYDFYSPFSFVYHVDKTIVIPTGIRCQIDDGWVLQLYPRSGLGFKTGIRLANTCGIIDSDYYNANNEGHIMVKMITPSRIYDKKEVGLKNGERFVQGIFLPYGITVDDEIDAVRYGGTGSTGK